jgi:glycosyltransferase involved in cell wall biosynthesis
VLSETFILHEILALEARGVPIHIFSLSRPTDALVHEDVARLKAPVSYLPEIASLEKLLSRHQQAAQHDRQQYLRALTAALQRPDREGFWCFLHSGYVADKARRFGLRHLHAHFATRATEVASLASQMAGIPYSFTAHAYDIYKSDVNFHSLTERIAEAKFVVAISEFTKTYLERLSNGTRGKIVRLYNGIDLTRFIPNGTPPQIPFTILCVARLVEKKGLPLLIEASKYLRDRGVVFRCWIVGTGPLGPRLAALIEQWQLREYVFLLGPCTQREVLARYHAAHLYVLPCLVNSDGNRDGLPVALVEALACGLPVITTPVAGIPEVVRHHYNGLLVPEGNATALANAIEAVINDHHLYSQLQANARASVVPTFDLGQTAQVLHKLFVADQS